MQDPSSPSHLWLLQITTRVKETTKDHNLRRSLPQSSDGKAVLQLQVLQAAVAEPAVDAAQARRLLSWQGHLPDLDAAGGAVHLQAHSHHPA